MTYIDENELLSHLRAARDAFSEKEYEDAYKYCQLALNLDPENTYAKKTIKKAAKYIRKARIQELKKRMKALKQLWDLQEYDKLLKEYEALNKFYPDHPKVLVQIARLKSLSRQKHEKTSTQYKKDIKKNIKTLHKQKKYLDAISAIEQVKPHFEGESWPDGMMQDIKHDYVLDQLKLRKELLEHQEYEKLYRFLSKLYTIFPEPRIKKHIEHTENLILENKKYEKSVFIEDSLDLINSLYSQKKYEDSMQVCEELFSVTGETSVKAKTFYARSKNANEKEMNEMIQEMMKNKNTNLQKEYETNPEEFVSI